MIKKIIINLTAFLIIVHCTFNIDNCSAQWVQMSNGIGTNCIIHSITKLGTDIYAGAYGIYRSTNNGLNWSITGLSSGSVWALVTIGNNIFAGANGVYISSNNGTDWTQTLNNDGIYSFTTSGNLIIAGGIGKVYVSSNNGSNWNQTVVGNSTITSLITLGNNIFAGEFSYPPVGIYKSTNNGINWNQTSLNNQSINCLAVRDNYLFAGTPDHGIFITTNNGTNWTQTATNILNINSIIISGNNIFAGAWDGVYLSTNNGISLINKSQGLISNPGVLTLFISDNYIFAGTNNYYVWRRTLSEIIGIKQISEIVPEKYSLSQNYPNPFNPETKIRFTIPGVSPIGLFGDDKVVLKVFDILGKEISTLVNEKLQPGTYDVTFNALQYPGGVYFYRLIADGFTDSKKMILLK